MALTIWDKPLGLSSHNRKQKITNFERSMLQLTPRARSIIIGILLSDGWMNKYGHWNPRLGLKQSLKNFPYLFYVYNELSYLCSGPLYSSKNKLRGKEYISLAFQTRQLESLLEIWNLLYVKKKKKNMKTIKYDLYNYMNYIVLAHWIMGDGSYHFKAVILCTHGFSLEEVVILFNILIIKFDISPTIQISKAVWDPEMYKKMKAKDFRMKNRYLIRIGRKDLEKLRPKLLPYFCDHFLYKINGKGVKH